MNILTRMKSLSKFKSMISCFKVCRSPQIVNYSQWLLELGMLALIKFQFVGDGSGQKGIKTSNHNQHINKDGKNVQI